MERAKKHLVFLDTHVVIWLYDGLTSRLTKKVVKILNENDLYISPIVSLEIKYLFEVKKIKVKPDSILASLSHSIGIQSSNPKFRNIIDIALTLDWTRDLFDRMIVAESYLNNAYLISKDIKIRKHYPLAIW